MRGIHSQITYYSCEYRLFVGWPPSLLGTSPQPVFSSVAPGSKIAPHSSSSSMTCRSHLALGVLPGPQPQSSRWTRRLGCSTASALRPRPGYAAQPEVGSGRGGVPLQSTDFYRVWWTPARRCFSRSRRTGRLQKPAALLSAGPGPSPSRTRLGRSCRVSPRLLTSSSGEPARQPPADEPSLV